MAVEDLPLDLANVALDLADDRLVVVDDVIDDRVQHRARPERRMSGDCSRLARTSVSRDGALCDVQHGVRCHEDLDLAELDLFDVGEVLGGLQHEEQRVAVALQLRALVRIERVLDDEVVQVDVQADLLELGLRRLEQAGPAERVVTAALAPVGGVEPTRLANTVHVQRAVDDHPQIVSQLSDGGLGSSRAAR